jgi:hypothetical protein
MAQSQLLQTPGQGKFETVVWAWLPEPTLTVGRGTSRASGAVHAV